MADDGDREHVTVPLMLTTPRAQRSQPELLQRQSVAAGSEASARRADSPTTAATPCGTGTPRSCSTQASRCRAVSEYLGHSDPGFTLRTYTHLMPSSSERTRDAVDAAFATTQHQQHRLRVPKRTQPPTPCYTLDTCSPFRARLPQVRSAFTPVLRHLSAHRRTTRPRSPSWGPRPPPCRTATRLSEHPGLRAARPELW